MKRTHLPLNGLRVLDAAARHLSFTRAADELAVTPACPIQVPAVLFEQLDNFTNFHSVVFPYCCRVAPALLRHSYVEKDTHRHRTTVL